MRAIRLKCTNGRAALMAGVIAVLLAGCVEQPPQALGTLEFDRITLPAPAAERIVAVHVREGQRVAAGQLVLQLEETATGSTAQALQAQAAGQRSALDELEAGPRREQVDRGRAELAASQAQAREADSYYARLQPLGRRQLVAAADVDSARAAAASAAGQARAAQAALSELQHGTRREQVAQGVAALAAATAQAAAQQVSVDKLSVVAPRAGVIDSLPYKLGDQAPVGAPLAVMLVGDAPYARVYVPEPIRANVAVGQQVKVYVDGRAQALDGRVRMVRSEPSFTPYYALIGDDVARLSYLAEIDLTAAQAAALPAGLPVRVEFTAGGN
ncbi:MAG: HlyD family secretion protein [Lysobacter sp.]